MPELWIIFLFVKSCHLARCWAPALDRIGASHDDNALMPETRFGPV